MALLSAFDKTGLEEFAKRLQELGFGLLGSAGTAKHLNDLGIVTQDVADFVGEPILGHKVVTLSRELHAALLADDTDAENAELVRIKMPRIDLVYVNLYPLVEEIAKADCTLASVLAKTDIGGPAMLRAAAKGRRITLCRPSEFELALQFLGGDRTGVLEDPEKFLSLLTFIVEKHVAGYCAASADFHQQFAGPLFAHFFDECSSMRAQ